MTTPRRYQFDNHLPAQRQEPPLPLYQPHPIPDPAAYDNARPIVVQHIHQAPPDRTVQRVALGAGVGGGAVAAGVYFGPLLVAAVSSMAISLGVLALAVTVLVWGTVTVVRSVGGPDGKAAAQTLAKARRRH